MIRLNWLRFSSFLSLRQNLRGEPCVYVQTDPQERILRVGESENIWNRYVGGTAYAVEAALHGSGNLFFVARAPADPVERKRLEATLIFQLQPRYNNQQKLIAPSNPSEYQHEGDVPRGLQAQGAA